VNTDFKNTVIALRLTAFFHAYENKFLILFINFHGIGSIGTFRPESNIRSNSDSNQIISYCIVILYNRYFRTSNVSNLSIRHSSAVWTFSANTIADVQRLIDPYDRNDPWKIDTKLNLCKSDYSRLRRSSLSSGIRFLSDKATAPMPFRNEGRAAFYFHVKMQCLSLFSLFFN